MMQRHVWWVRLIAALLWVVFVVGVVGPVLMELLDQHDLKGRVFGLPVVVTETLLIGIVACVPIVLLWRRTRRCREPTA
jgi:hypothetical protein